MKSRSYGWRVLFPAVALLLVVGCAKAQFVDKPGSPASGGQKLQAEETRQDKETSTPQDPDSVERTIDRILKGK